MKNKIINIIGILMIFSLVLGYGWVFDRCLKAESFNKKEKERREYIKFQRDSIELEQLKKNIK